MALNEELAAQTELRWLCNDQAAGAVAVDDASARVENRVWCASSRPPPLKSKKSVLGRRQFCQFDSGARRTFSYSFRESFLPTLTAMRRNIQCFQQANSNFFGNEYKLRMIFLHRVYLFCGAKWTGSI